jgi:hypothetical protein
MRTATPFTIENRFAKVSIGHHTHQGIEILVGENVDDNKGYLLLLEVIAVERDSAVKQTIGRGKAPEKCSSDWDDDGTVESGDSPSKRSRTSGASMLTKTLTTSEKILKTIIKTLISCATNKSLLTPSAFPNIYGISEYVLTAFSNNIFTIFCKICIYIILQYFVQFLFMIPCPLLSQRTLTQTSLYVFTVLAT